VGIALGTTIKYLRRKTSAAAGDGLGTTFKYLRGAAGNARALRSSSTTGGISKVRAQPFVVGFNPAAARASCFSHEIFHCGAQVVARGGARCASQVLSRGALADAPCPPEASLPAR
jgi:hypothetical protein